jgi:DNA-directed RNA polymerase subunit RPC12/RpoP
LTKQTPNPVDSLSPKIEFNPFGLIEAYICPSCGEELELDHKDDIGTKWFKCKKCGQQTSKPKSEARKQFEAIMEHGATINVNGLSITPFLNTPIKDVHPAIGEIDDVAYVGVWIPCLIKDKSGNVENKDKLFLIESNRKKILADDSELQRRLLRLAYNPIHFTNRWALNDVLDFLKGKEINVLETYKKVLDLYKEYIEFPDNRLYHYHALWTIGTYFHHLFSTYPYLYVGGVKRSGKSKTLRLHYCLDFNAVFSGNMSPSSIYRVIQNNRATLLIDETEKLSNPKRALEFRNILLSGFQKGTQVFRVEKGRKDRLEPETFEVYSPKVLANISGLEDVLEDRCIMTFQKRSINKAIINHEINIEDRRFSELRSELTILYLLHWKEINDVYHEIRDFSELSEYGELLKINTEKEQLEEIKKLEGFQYLSSRELELWKPIFSLSLFFSMYELTISDSPSSPSSLTSLMFSLACSQAAQRHTENITETGEEILVSVLSSLVEPGQMTNWIKVKDIKAKMNEQFEDEVQQWLTSRWVGSALRRLGFLDKRRVGTGYEYQIIPKVVDDLCERMQIPKLNNPPEENEATTCALCLKLLPADHKETTTWDRKEVHVSCFSKIQEGLRGHED